MVPQFLSEHIDEDLQKIHIKTGNPCLNLSSYENSFNIVNIWFDHKHAHAHTHARTLPPYSSKRLTSYLFNCQLPSIKHSPDGDTDHLDL